MAHQRLLKNVLLSVAAAGILLVAGCGESESRLRADAIMHNVKILDVSEGEAIADSAIVVVDGQISDIVSDRHIRNYAADTIIDGGGNFLIPALADVHVHIQSRAELQNFVRYGVGLVVNMSGGPQHLKMREAVASRGTLGPSIVSFGPTLDGDPPTNPLFVTVGPDSAPEVIEWIQKRGYDAVKVYQQMDTDTLAAVIAAANVQGLITSGHVSREIGVEQAINAGQRYVAHGEELAFESFDESSRTYDLDAVPELAERLSQAGVTVTPMVAYLENIPLQVSDLQEYLNSAEMQTVPVAMRMSFDQRQGWFANREDPDGFIGQITSLVSFVCALTAELDERDVPLILGTDAGFGGAIPGFSVHEELEALVDVGLSELAALQTATLNVGEYLKKIDPTHPAWGQIRPGYVASMVLVGANPIEDIAATKDIRGVMIGGQWVDKSDLARIESALALRQEALLPMARAFEDALVAGDPIAGGAAIESIPAEMAGEPLINADNCVFLGYRHYYGGNRPLAARLYELCAKMHPESSPLWIHIARAYESEEKTDAAVQAYRRAGDLNPWYGDPGSAIERLGTEAPVGNN